MLDTKLKNMRKIKNIIILLICVVPAIVLVALYPQMEMTLQEYQKNYELYRQEEMERYEASEYKWELSSGFVHMATETAYNFYAELLNRSIGETVDRSVLEAYGWLEDADSIKDATTYYAIYNKENVPYTLTNSGADLSGFMNLTDEERWNQLEQILPDAAGYMILSFDSIGNLDGAHVSMDDGISYEKNCYSLVLGSMEQYIENAVHWSENINPEFQAELLKPKDFQAVFILNDRDTFCRSYMFQIYEPDLFNYYLDMGAWIIVLIGAGLVALASLLLPLIKCLETGWEKIFGLPFEIIAAIFFAGIFGALGMFYLMCISTMTGLSYLTDKEIFYLIGIAITKESLIRLLLVLNVFGWSVCFFMEYIVVSAFRQFVCRPKAYLKEKVLSIRFLRWIKYKVMGFLRNVFRMDLEKRMHSGNIKFVIINGLIGALLCSLQIAGAIGFIVYSAVLYIFLKKHGRQIQGWYGNLLEATHQMAEGNLKFQMSEDQGIFKTISEELCMVQESFSKAVMEEARSQNMKTELITNVSHDLKTPLTAMITYIDLLKREDLTAGERENYLNIVDQKSQRLKVLIEDLFEVSKAASGNIQMNFMDVDVVSLMKEVRLEMEDKIESSSLDFKWNLPEEKIILSLDGQKTFRVFENLLNNILKYSMEHSRVYVDVIIQDENVCVMFRNISAMELSDDPERLMERCVRGDASRQTEGSGLGLAIAKSFVELQNGKLDIAIDGDLFKVTILWRR